MPSVVIDRTQRNGMEVQLGHHKKVLHEMVVKYGAGSSGQWSWHCQCSQYSSFHFTNKHSVDHRLQGTNSAEKPNLFYRQHGCMRSSSNDLQSPGLLSHFAAIVGTAFPYWHTKRFVFALRDPLSFQ